MGEAAANELISNSVFYISIGVNDYIHYYLRNASNIQNLYLPWSFNQFVAASIRQEIKVTFLVFYFSYFVVFMQERYLYSINCGFIYIYIYIYIYIIFSFNKSLEFKMLFISEIPNSCMFMEQNLYNMNVRRVILMGLPPIGCAPYYLWRYNSKNGECIEEINDIILEYNFVMRYMIEELGLKLPDAKITFCDMYEGSMDIIKNHELYGKACNIFLPYAAAMSIEFTSLV
jgi:hypothetical protein